MNQHPQIRCHGEVFFHNYTAADGYLKYLENTESVYKKLYNNNNWQLLNRKVLMGAGNEILLGKSTTSYFEQLFFDPNHPMPFTEFENDSVINPVRNFPEKYIIGFKLMYGQLLENKTVRKLIRKTKPLIIHFKRDNQLEMAVSRLQSWNSGVYHSNKMKQQKIFIEKKKLLNILRNIENQHRKILGFLKEFDVLEIKYEDFFKSESFDSVTIFNFLDAETASMEQLDNIKKVGAEKLEDRIENYEEVYQFLKHTKYATYI